MKVKLLLVLFVCLLALREIQALEIIPVSEIKPGMKGTTFTVLQGTNIVPIETEIMGIAENDLGPGMDLIIGRLVDEKTKLTGAVHGMSGSPLYIEGRLAGALSRRIALFEKDGHCGFTPIVDMLEVGQKGSLPNGSSPRHSLLSPLAWLSPAENEHRRFQSSWLGVPLTVSHVSELGMKILEKIWHGSGFLLSAGGGSSRDATRAGGELEPGAPVAAAMATGDLQMAGTGTLTWREGDKILAFGHPMFGLGEIAMPMCEAEIITTIPSYAMPYKLANVRRVVGTVEQDRLAAISGTVGKPPTLPHYRIEVDFEEEKPRVYEGEFVSHEWVTPGLIPSLLLQTVLGNNQVGADFTIQAQGDFKLKGYQPVQLNTFSSGTEFSLFESAINMAQKIAQLYTQPFTKIEPESFEVKLNIRTRQSLLLVDSISVTPQRPQPEDELSIAVRLKPRFGDFEWKTFQATLPPQFRSGDVVDIEVADARTFSERDYGNASSTILVSDGSSLDTLDQLIEKLNRQRSPNDLILRITIRRPGIKNAQERLEGLPPSVQRVMSDSEQVLNPLTTQTLVEQTISLNAFVRGSAKSSVIVE